MKGFRVLSPGILTTYQDLGRRGFRQYGIPRSGAMDTVALRAANLLVGNRESDVGLEVTLMGLKMEALSPLFIAVTGADLHFTINTEYHPPWRNFALKPGDTVHFARRRSGLRAYLAVNGGFQSPTFLESGSVFQRGLMGAPLRKDDLLFIREGQGQTRRETLVPALHPTGAVEKGSIRVILGPQAERFTDAGIHHFLNEPYRITSQSDRMAYRLDGPKIPPKGKADIISEPLLTGAIQVPNDGCPLILMVDGQVTGGYAKIANVISADIPLLAQKAPGDSIRFKAVDLDTAHDALKQQEEALLRLRDSLSLS